MEELVEVKMGKLVEKSSTKDIALLGSGDSLDPLKMTPTFQAVTTALRAGLDAAIPLVSKHSLSFSHFVLGATAWYRMLKDNDEPEDVEKVDTFLADLKANLDAYCVKLGLDVSLVVQEIPGSAEAQYEYKAVEHAIRETALPPPMAQLAGGSGSVQVVGLDTMYTMNAPLKAGMALIDGKDGRASGIRQWRKQVQAAFGGNSLTGLLQKASKEKAKAKEPVRVVLISGFFYAAVAAKVVEKNVETYRYQPADMVCEMLRRLQVTPPRHIPIRHIEGSRRGGPL